MSRPRAWGQTAARLAAVDNETLILDLLEWLADRPRTYMEVMDAWRTSCPRLSIWEDTLDAGLIDRQGPNVTLTDEGLAFLCSHRGLDPRARNVEDPPACAHP